MLILELIILITLKQTKLALVFFSRKIIPCISKLLIFNQNIFYQWNCFPQKNYLYTPYISFNLIIWPPNYSHHFFTCGIVSHHFFSCGFPFPPKFPPQDPNSSQSNYPEPTSRVSTQRKAVGARRVGEPKSLPQRLSPFEIFQFVRSSRWMPHLQGTYNLIFLSDPICIE